MERANDMPNEAVKGMPQDWAQLIRKLRWIGLETCRLQAAVCMLPPDQRGTVSAGPFSTD